ncbi:MAG: SDR family NAD(P)-dependent oxidoreductase [Anaerolineaceae bacterium]|nr:SDR family NAD(P)-dependent oxidoreductase [Anaerolineaceae bacterium]
MKLPRVALITGASSGIGKETAIALLQHGVNVAGTSRKIASLQPLSILAEDFPGDFLALQADVRSSAAMQDAVNQLLERFGQLDFLIANAGIGHTGGLMEASESDIQQLLQTNIDGVIHSVRAAVPAMRQNVDGGHIMIVSSVVAPMTLPYSALYAASKAAVSSLARSLYHELKEDRIHVSDFLLGRTETNFIANRLGQARSQQARMLPAMSAETVGRTILGLLEKKPRSFVARPFDRLLLMVNRILPDFVARRALRHYGGKN